MPFTRTKKATFAAAVAVLLVAGLLLARRFSPASGAAARQQLLQLIPTDATAVIYLDLGQLRQSPFLAKLNLWAPHPAEDSEYAQFVRDTGFSYDRDLTRAVVAISNHGATTTVLAIADGNFDRKKIETFLDRGGKSAQQEKWKVYLLNASSHDKPLSLVFLTDNRIAITDSENFPAAVSAAAGAAGHAEWNSRFDRLAGTPLFAVLRQDPAMQNALNSAAPGGFRSPQLSALLDQLRWISIAGKPTGEQLQLVTEGECSSESVASQLQDFLQGILMLAQNGLNDPKLRQKMNPQEREAYLEILQSADIQKIDRGDWKSVRVVLSITPKFLDLARVNSLAVPAADEPSGPRETPKKPASGKTGGQKK